MKDLSKKIRNGGVEKFNGLQLGLNTQGKGSFYRISNADDQYKENYDKIFKKNKCQPSAQSQQNGLKPISEKKE